MDSGFDGYMMNDTKVNWSEIWKKVFKLWNQWVKSTYFSKIWKAHEHHNETNRWTCQEFCILYIYIYSRPVFFGDTRGLILLYTAICCDLRGYAHLCDYEDLGGRVIHYKDHVLLSSMLTQDLFQKVKSLASGKFEWNFR